jgi:4-aminobutyrate aminotransferase-like enzyme/Ser/Thr protein kinase RdoA (MazF antagonist)
MVRGKFDRTVAATIAFTRYGLRVEAHALPGEFDFNFHLIGDDGREFVLKIMHPERPRDLIDLQCQALDHLARRDPSLGLPRVHLTSKGEFLTIHKDDDGVEHYVWMLTYIQGGLLAKARPQTPEMLRSLGRILGRIDRALEDFSHPAADRSMKWDLSRAGWIGQHLSLIESPSRRSMIEKILAVYHAEVLPHLEGLRKSVIHNDANDYNVLVAKPGASPREVLSVIDFGDAISACTIFEPAIAAAYALLEKPDPLASAAAVIGGFHEQYPLRDQELALLFPLICTRLAVSVVNSACAKLDRPHDPYVAISERPAWEALEKLSSIHPRFAHYMFRAACGLTPVPHSPEVAAHLAKQTPAPILDVDLRNCSSLVFDLSVGSRLLGADPAAMENEALTKTLKAEMELAGAQVGVGRYDEARPLYTTPAFGTGDATEERRTVHLGMDLFNGPGAPVFAPLDGRIYRFANNAARLDYGPVIILQHQINESLEFFTLYGHLSEDSLKGLTLGGRVRRGERIASVGSPPTNGDWPPHLHFQIIADLMELDCDFPGVARASERAVWTSLSPDPNLLLKIPADRFPPNEPTKAETLAARKKYFGGNLSIAYRDPLKIVRGWRQYLYDETGRAYLDVYNNVPLVGHSHPKVVRAAQQQMALLNTNTRYLHDNIIRYAERLTELTPEPLSVCFFLNSASEANELALRLARAHTGAEDVIALEAAYHGNTTSLIDISPYKFNGPGGKGRKPWVHIAPLADDYRGPYKRDDREAGRKYALAVAEIIDRITAGGGRFAAYIAETLPSVGGQIVFPPGYLAEVYRQVRAAGAVCIADEVQVGFGRLGSHFWGFETQGVVPDIVVLGKPIGNAHPLAAVITTPQIAASFHNGMEFFSTFGGNPVSCAVGLAVLDVLQEERLQENALTVGEQLLAGLCALMDRYPLIGDVRGSGFFLGVELVRDRRTLEPAAEEASYIVNRLREYGVLAGTDGPLHNVLKLRPPMVFSGADADFFLRTMEEILSEDAVLR